MAITTPVRKPPFQFGLVRLFAAVTCGALAVFLALESVTSGNPILWASAGTTAGVAIGALLGRTIEGASFGFGGAIFTCCVGFPFWAMQMQAVPESKLAQIRVGLNRDEIRQLLGRPTHDNDSTWIYARMTWAHLNVHFDADGKVRDFDHDF